VIKLRAALVSLAPVLYTVLNFPDLNAGIGVQIQPSSMLFLKPSSLRELAVVPLPAHRLERKLT